MENYYIYYGRKQLSSSNWLVYSTEFFNTHDKGVDKIIFQNMTGEQSKKAVAALNRAQKNGQRVAKNEIARRLRK